MNYKKAMRELTKARLCELRKQPYSSLLELQDSQGEKLKIDGKLVTVTIWKDVISEGKLRIVVQVYYPWFLGIGRMDAKGFIVSRNGDICDLNREDIYEFV